jgi:hypothetical protein
VARRAVVGGPSVRQSGRRLTAGRKGAVGCATRTPWVGSAVDHGLGADHDRRRAPARLPRIRDTRMTVSTVLGQLAARQTIEQVLSDGLCLERANVPAGNLAGGRCRATARRTRCRASQSGERASRPGGRPRASREVHVRAFPIGRSGERRWCRLGARRPVKIVFSASKSATIDPGRHAQLAVPQGAPGALWRLRRERWAYAEADRLRAAGDEGFEPPRLPPDEADGGERCGRYPPRYRTPPR